MNSYDSERMLNIGFGSDVSIKELGLIIKDIVGYKGDFEWDSSKPDGMPKKLMDSSKIFNLGWYPKVSLIEGLTQTYRWYCMKYGKELK